MKRLRWRRVATVLGLTVMGTAGIQAAVPSSPPVWVVLVSALLVLFAATFGLGLIFWVVDRGVDALGRDVRTISSPRDLGYWQTFLVSFLRDSSEKGNDDSGSP